MSQTLPSVCPLDCPDTCSMTVTVTEDRIVHVRGSRVNPLTHGAVCVKVTHYPELVHGPDRPLTPLKRIGAKGEGAWMRTSDNGQTVLALAPSHYADLNDGACYNDARVEVAPLSPLLDS